MSTFTAWILMLLWNAEQFLLLGGRDGEFKVCGLSFLSTRVSTEEY